MALADTENRVMYSLIIEMNSISKNEACSLGKIGEDYIVKVFIVLPKASITTCEKDAVY
jgi:hypothetical protein